MELDLEETLVSLSFGAGPRMGVSCLGAKMHYRCVSYLEGQSAPVSEGLQTLPTFKSCQIAPFSNCPWVSSPYFLVTSALLSATHPALQLLP